MSSTSFLDGQTVIYASWLNDVNATVYNGTFPNGTISPITVNATSVNATNGSFTNLTFSTFTTIPLPNNWLISTTSSKIFFTYNGTNVASIDTSGNIRALGSVIAGTTP
jgi:hypothetical protein